MYVLKVGGGGGGAWGENKARRVPLAPSIPSRSIRTRHLGLLLQRNVTQRSRSSRCSISDREVARCLWWLNLRTRPPSGGFRLKDMGSEMFSRYRVSLSCLSSGVRSAATFIDMETEENTSRIYVRTGNETLEREERAS